MARYVQITDGEWLRILQDRKHGHTERCCDCALTHRNLYRRFNGKLHVRVRRDNKATAAARKRLGITIVINRGGKRGRT